MSRSAVAVVIVGLLLVVEPVLDGLAGCLLIIKGHRTLGGLVLSVSVAILIALLFSLLPARLSPFGVPGMGAGLTRYNVNLGVGLFALVYSVAAREWQPASVLFLSTVLIAIGGRAVLKGLADWS